MPLKAQARAESPEKEVGDTITWTLTGAITPGETSQVILIRGPRFRIGRRRDFELCINSSIVSGAHAEILECAGSVFLRDTGSTNGTFLNGKRISHDTIMSDGDVIEIGDVFFRVQSHQKKQAARTEPLLTKTNFVDDAHDLQAQRSLVQMFQAGQLSPCFQAIHCLESGFVRGYEYLARSPLAGIETAGKLFEQARKAGREIELSMLCRRKALAFSTVIEAHQPVFLNTHPVEPLLQMVLPQMQELRDAYPERGMVLEIHEAAITEPGLIRELRKELADINVRLAFDDFGRGQARIRELICATSDYIKFDSALISDLQHVSREQFRFFASIVQGIRREGAITVAEGVETEEMATVCREIGFDLVQGFLFSRPTLLL
jgi:EAL domain-containing protein (putative c-di-GMP-specific phosphodiesterase class I)